MTTEPVKGIGKIIFSSSLGTLIEWYDFYIFGMLAKTISVQFFPEGNDTAALLSTLAIFASGFLVRPFGALVFGRLGDLIGARGIVAVRSYSIPGFPWASPNASEEMKAALRASGVATLASMSLYAGGVAEVNPGAQVGVGLSAGTGGGDRGGGFSVGGIGISFPIGGATGAQSLAASSSLTAVAQGTLVWSGSASTPASGDILAQVGALTQVAIEAIQRVGLI